MSLPVRVQGKAAEKIGTYVYELHVMVPKIMVKNPFLYVLVIYGTFRSKATYIL